MFVNMKNPYITLYKINPSFNSSHQMNSIKQNIVYFISTYKKEWTNIFKMSSLKSLECEEFYVIQHKTTYFLLIKGKKFYEKVGIWRLKKLYLIFLIINYTIL